MNHKPFRMLSCVALIAVLTACGGSGSGSMLGGIEGSGSPVTSAGAVTALGSVFVNGVKYDLTGAAITVDGRLAREDDLAVGSIVVVEGTVNADGVTGRATRVTAGTAVAGPIASIDLSNQRFTVLGQTVVADAGTVIEPTIDGLPLGGLAIGSDVEISGFTDSSGTIRARRIAPRQAERPLQVTGSVTELDTFNRRFTINGAAVDYSAATLTGFGSVQLADAAVRVTARTRDANGALVADQVAYRDAHLPGSVGDAAAVQGWVTRYASATDFDVDGYRVVVNSATTITGNLGLDAFVDVKGEIIAEGAVQVSQLVETAPFRIRVGDATGEPLVGALVTITDVDGAQQQVVTGADGVASFAAAPARAFTVYVTAPGYEPITLYPAAGSGSRDYIMRLRPEREWAIGRAIVLGARVLERASDGSNLRVSLDVAVIDENSQAIQTFTSADFSLHSDGCDWNGPRGCASDVNGNMTGNSYTAGPALAFGLQPPRARQPYRTRVLAVRYNEDTYGAANWEEMAPALKAFFAQVGGNDTVSLSTAQVENGRTTHTVLGPFTSDGSQYLEAIDDLASPGSGEPAILDSLIESIAGVAGVGSDASVLVIAPSMMSIEDFHAANGLARQLGVRVSSVDFWTYGVPEMAPRTGGFTVNIGDRRHIPMVLGAIDQVLAGTLPFYRMEFEITGPPGTFVANGNVKVALNIQVPTMVPSLGIWTPLDIPVE